MISIKVLQHLLPFIRRDLTNLINEKVITSLRRSVSEDLKQTASDLLHMSLQSTCNTEQLCAKMDTLDLKVDSVNAELGSLKGDLSSLNDAMNRISDNVEAHDNHVTTELMELDQNLEQNFSLQLNNSYGYRTSTCGGLGWRRVVYLNFTDPNTPCPSGWQLTSRSKRTCGRVNKQFDTCDSVTFPVGGGDYTRVCGRIIGYQYQSPYAFGGDSDYNRATNIDGAYVDGLSLTHGSPRQHIWTFAAGASEFWFPTLTRHCPCDADIVIPVPLFVGEDYFCESGNNRGFGAFFPDDPLWDGDGCIARSTCCSFNNPPYFTKQLPTPTTDGIEARLCQYHEVPDTPIEFIELYVQ